MWCYDCSQQAIRREAIGVCHHCSVGVCTHHGTMVSDPVLIRQPVAKVEALPKKARELLCHTCLAALGQDGATSELTGARGGT